MEGDGESKGNQGVGPAQLTVTQLIHIGKHSFFLPLESPF